MIKIGLHAFTLTLFVNFVKETFEISEKTLKSLLSHPPAPLKVTRGVGLQGLTTNYTNLKFIQNQRAL
jgi:hypothetical protein